MKAYLIFNEEHLDWVTKRLTPNGSNQWKDLEMVDNINEAEYLIIINKPPKPMPLFSPEKILYYKMEPDGFDYVRQYWDDADPKSHFYPNKEHNLIPAGWKMKENWTKINAMEFAEKTEDLLYITGTTGNGREPSWVQVLEGHRLRMQFLDKFMQKYPDVLHLYGRGTEKHGGFGKTPLRTELLQSHRYIFSFENSLQDGYATEKIYDGLMMLCMPIYWGCPNLEEFLPSGSFIRLDICKDDACERVMDIISSSFREDHLDALREAKKRVLNDIGFMPTFYRDITKLEAF